MKSKLHHHRLSVFLACISLLAASIQVGFAEEIPALMSTLQTAIDKEESQKPQRDEAANRYDGRGNMGFALVAQLRAAISRASQDQADEVLNQIRSYWKSDAVRDAANNLGQAMQADQAARDKARGEVVNNAISAAVAAIQKAKTPADLDEAISTLGKMSEQNDYRNSERDHSRIQKVANARQFVILWQDYLSCLASGKLEEAVQHLRNASNRNEVNLVPRSEILAKLNALSTPGQPEAPAKPVDQRESQIKIILANTKSLDQIPAAIDAVSALPRSSDGSYSFNNFAQELRKQLGAIQREYLNYQSGLPCEIPVIQNLENTETTQVANLIQQLRVQLIRLILPRVLMAGDSLKPTQDESIQNYLDRVMSVAQKEPDAQLLGRVKEAQDAIAGKRSSRISAGIQALATAQNQEVAGQYIPAVISYQTALKSNDELVPAKAIGEHLQAIQRDHPEDYERGLKMFLDSQNQTRQPYFYYGSTPPVGVPMTQGTNAVKTAASLSPSPSQAPSSRPTPPASSGSAHTP